MIQMRFGDTDALGHVNNASFAAYTEVARLDFALCLGDAVSSLILANLTIDYRRQLSWGESVHVDTWLERLGRTSFAVGQSVFGNGKLTADVKSVVVYFDYAGGRPRELTPEMREQLGAYWLTESAAPRSGVSDGF
jgi:acyl-CoA thioester hydrolase